MKRLLIAAVSALLAGAMMDPSILRAQPELPLREVSVDDLVRSYRVYVPDQVAENPGLIIALHGTSGSSEQSIRVVGSQLMEIADEHGHIIAFPNGEGGWNTCRRGSSNPASVNNINDVGFIEAIINDMEDEFHVHRQRLFLLGYSGGGHLAYQVAMERPNLMAGIASLMMVVPAGPTLTCKPSDQPVSMIIVNGTADPVVPFEGGTLSRNDDGSPDIQMLSTAETFEYWANLAGLSGEPIVINFPDIAPNDGSTVEMRTLESATHEVSLVVVHGGMHRIPGQPPVGDMPVNRDVNAIELVWDFFDRQIQRNLKSQPHAE